MPESPPDMTITKHKAERRRGWYAARVAGIDAEAKLIVTRHAPELLSADHTKAPEELRKTGAAPALVAYLVADARESGFRIIPLCPYVRSQYEKHPEWSDAFTVAPGEVPAEP
jgi:hypothetical protein